MKLRKAIKLAAAGAIIGVMPAMASAVDYVNTPVEFGAAWNADGNGAINYTCPTDFTCGAVMGGVGSDDIDFVQVQITDSSGDVFIHTIGYESDAEGDFDAESFVAFDTNAGISQGIGSRQYVGDDQVNNGSADFKLTAFIATGGVQGNTGMGGDGFMEVYTNSSGAMGMLKVDLIQSLAKTDGSWDAGFDFKHGMIMGGGAFVDLVIDGGSTSKNMAGVATFTDSFTLTEYKVEKTTDPVKLAAAQLTLVATSSISTSGEEAFSQDFTLNEAEGAATEGSGTITVGGTDTVTFLQGQTVVGLTIDQTLDGAVNFSLSDTGNESANVHAGVDSFTAASSLTVVMDDTNLNDPFVSF